jgi:perosamine synthetase
MVIPESDRHGGGTEPLALSKPDITPLEERYVLAALRSGRLSMGPYTEQFEVLVAERAGCRFGVAVNSGTSGLHLALLALGIGPGDEVITTPFSFIASANAILFVGATPKFIDICPRSLNMDPSRLEAAITPRTRAILAVETFGNPAHMDAYASIAARHEIPLIEDCCEALGTTLRGRPAGHFGRIGVFGFYPNKQITTGEGGMIVTNDERLAALCRSMRNQGRPIGHAAASAVGGTATGSWLRHERLGFNFRMSEINAALGVAQMKRLDSIMERRGKVANMYIRRLSEIKDLVVPTIDEGTVMSWFVFVVRLSPTYTAAERDRVIAGLRAQEIGASDYFPCIHLQGFYREQFGFEPGMFPMAETVSHRTIALPFYNDLTERDVEIVASELEVLIRKENLSRD